MSGLTVPFFPQGSQFCSTVTSERQGDFVPHHGNLHRGQSGGEDEVRQIVAVANEGQNAVAPPAHGNLGRVDHVRDNVPTVFPGVTRGAFEEAVVRVGESEQNSAGRGHGARSLGG